MANDADKWAKKVSDAADHALKVYQNEVERLEKQVADTDKKEGREVEHVAHQVDRDVNFAAHHIEHLEKVVAKEEAKVDRAYARIDEKKQKGASDDALRRAAEHAAKVEDGAAKHLERVIERTVADIERDAKAAARHVVKGLDRIGEAEDHLDDDAEADAEKVLKALEKVDVKLSK